ncbi:cellulose synthase subunit BcsC-related outer membrane protein [Pseudomonas sp. PCH446]
MGWRDSQRRTRPARLRRPGSRVYGYGALHKLIGNNVESNTRAELGGGIYWYLDNQPDDKLTLGLSTTALSYENNQGFFTYGHGGYFSPQTFFSVAVPVTWSQRSERFTYKLSGAVGSSISTRKAPTIFPATAPSRPPTTSPIRARAAPASATT